MTRPANKRFTMSLLAILAAALAAPGAAGAADGAGAGSRILVDRVAAVVGDSVVLYSDVMLRAAPMLANVHGIADPTERERRRTDIESRVLDELVDEELMIQAAREAGIEVEEREVDAALEEIQQQHNLSAAELEQELVTQGYTMEGYRKDLERQLLRMHAVRMLIQPRVNIGDDEVRTRYEQKRRQTGAVSRVHLRHILVQIPQEASEDERDAGRDEAAELARQARADADFEELAREHSDDAATRPEGGDLGWIERGSLPTEWEDIVFAMEPGDVRGPIAGPRGVHVFYVEDREIDEADAFEEVEESIREELFQKELERQTERWLDSLRGETHVDVKLRT